MSRIVLPVSRMIGGSLYKMAARLDDAGKPKIGADGTPETHCNFGVAIPKGGEKHWNETEWGAEIYAIGKAAYPTEHATRFFAWKIVDGDSNELNRKGKAPSSNPNYQGQWVLWLSQGWAPKIVTADGSATISEPDAVVPGYYVRAMIDVKGNAPSKTAGVYINPVAVAFMYEGEKIESEIDTSAFGKQPVSAPPAGAKPIAPAVEGFKAAPAPNYAFPDRAVNPPAPPAPPKPKGKQLTSAAMPYTLESLYAAGWTDDTLIAAGMMTP